MVLSTILQMFHTVDGINDDDILSKDRNRLSIGNNIPSTTTDDNNGFVVESLLNSTTTTTRAVQPNQSQASMTQQTNIGHHHGQTLTTSTTTTITPSSTSSTTTPTTTTMLEGIPLQESQQLDDGTTVYRNGYGIRSINFFGLDIKVYVAQFFSLQPLQNEQQVMDQFISDSSATINTSTATNTNPMQFDFTFLRHIGQSRVVSAWTQQLDHSVSHKYHGYEHDRAKFIHLCSSQSIKEGGTQTIRIIGDNTHIIDQGQYKGSVEGKQFQHSFCSMWFGPDAVAQDLKHGLLQGHSNVVVGNQKGNNNNTNIINNDDILLTKHEQPLEHVSVQA